MILSGVVSEEDRDHILVGQVCSARLSELEGLYSDPDALVYTNYQWSVGGDTFDRFDRAQDDEWGRPQPVPSWIVPTPSWCWRKDEDEVSVTCSAQLWVNGQSIGTVTAERKVQVWTPYHDLFRKNYGTSFEVIGGVPSVKAGAPGGPGVEFKAAVGTPAKFAYQGYGRFFYVQLIKINRQKSPDRWPLPPFSVTTNDEFWLDNEWPYNGYQDASSTDLDRVEMGFVDAPDTNLTEATAFQVTDAFQCYLMYEPPYNGIGVQPVALHRVDWRWEASSSRNLSLFGDLGPWIPDPPKGGCFIDAEGWRSGHPQWKHRWSNK